MDLYSVIRRLLGEGSEEADEKFPAQLVSVLFIMLWKGAKKGTVNEFGAYRPIGLMRHACKLADMVFVEELAEDTELFLDPHTSLVGTYHPVTSRGLERGTTALRGSTPSHHGAGLVEYDLEN